MTPVQNLAEKVKAVYRALQPAESDPMLDFDERDLLALAQRSGFSEIHLQYEADVQPASPERWDAFMNIPGNPKIPSVRDAMRQTLTPDEAERLSAQLERAYQGGQGSAHSAVAYLWAVN